MTMVVPGELVYFQISGYGPGVALMDDVEPGVEEGGDSRRWGKYFFPVNILALNSTS